MPTGARRQIDEVEEGIVQRRDERRAVFCSLVLGIALAGAGLLEHALGHETSGHVITVGPHQIMDSAQASRP